MMGGGMMTPLGGAKVVQLTNSTDKIEVKDRDGFPLFRVDASGNVYWKGSVKRI